MPRGGSATAAAATLQGEIMQGHLMAFQSHRLESQVETQLVPQAMAIWAVLRGCRVLQSPQSSDPSGCPTPVPPTGLRQ